MKLACRSLERIWEELGKSKDYNQNILLENKRNRCFEKIKGNVFICLYVFYLIVRSRVCKADSNVAVFTVDSHLGQF